MQKTIFCKFLFYNGRVFENYTIMMICDIRRYEPENNDV